MPVLHWTEEDDDGNPAGNPSFDKHAMKKYLTHPYAPVKIVELIAEYRQLSTHRSLFLEKYQELATQSPDGQWALHGSYQQCLRTGRMGCQKPNAQQLDKKTKRLIKPKRGMAFMSVDESQIEFRIIVHYIQDDDCIRAYEKDPDTDFHQWVADVAGMKRKPAKTMNFMMGYGGGKKKAVRTMAVDTEVVGGLIGQVDQMVANGTIRKDEVKRVFDEMCKIKAEQVYDTYHRTLPGLKPTSRRAASACAERGYVFNGAGRRRHLPPTHSHVAFNSLCQSFAADIQKERTIALYRALQGTGIEMVANVHDETLLQGDVDVIMDRRTQIAVAWILEHTTYKLRVPLRVGLGVSAANWYEANDSAKPMMYDEREKLWLMTTSEYDLFDWIRKGSHNLERQTHDLFYA
jgi:DNA polymerase I-like protein with 3'-5' exonuclease and polymerase domains